MRRVLDQSDNGVATPHVSPTLAILSEDGAMLLRKREKSDLGCPTHIVSEKFGIAAMKGDDFSRNEDSESTCLSYSKTATATSFTSNATDGLLQSIEIVKKEIRFQLYKWEDVPHFLRDNEYIHAK